MMVKTAVEIFLQGMQISYQMPITNLEGNLFFSPELINQSNLMFFEFITESS